jgi:hypothetical protein
VKENEEAEGCHTPKISIRTKPMRAWYEHNRHTVRARTTISAEKLRIIHDEGRRCSGQGVWQLQKQPSKIVHFISNLAPCLTGTGRAIMQPAWMMRAEGVQGKVFGCFSSNLAPCPTGTYAAYMDDEGRRCSGQGVWLLQKQPSVSFGIIQSETKTHPSGTRQVKKRNSKNIKIGVITVTPILLVPWYKEPIKSQNVKSEPPCVGPNMIDEAKWPTFVNYLSGTTLILYDDTHSCTMHTLDEHHTSRETANHNQASSLANKFKVCTRRYSNQVEGGRAAAF